MKEILQKNGWVNYRTGCSCVGLPRYWKNDGRMGWEIITKGERFTIKRDGNVVDSGVASNFNELMKKYELI
ncbi:hypothetical protein [Proteiniphilum sp. X52]|uniref:hypothetical protein n=1 Tax=Proteiniphilum sp. X52 TaxID=2382159 RepID=UPI0011CE48DE|nr:hypothetical protein [Proteiniphilum sp. X52]